MNEKWARTDHHWSGAYLFYKHWPHTAGCSEQCNTRRRGEKASNPPSSFSASQMEKQFITLSDSLSETDMIKNNIKWIMFSSDWYHYNCRPDFCQHEALTNKNTHTHTHSLWGRDRHTDAVISCLCAWVICPHSLLQMAQRLKPCGGTNDVSHVFREEKQQ